VTARGAARPSGVNAPPTRPAIPRARLRAGLRSLLFTRAPRLALRLLEADRHELGLAGEALAARALRAAGWRLRGRRLRTPAGEVDLWATDGRTSLVVEVKTGRPPRLVLPRRVAERERAGREPRWDLRRRPATSLSAAQAERLHRAARILARRTGLQPQLRLIEVLVGPRGHPVEVRGTWRVAEPARPARPRRLYSTPP